MKLNWEDVKFSEFLERFSTLKKEVESWLKKYVGYFVELNF